MWLLGSLKPETQGLKGTQRMKSPGLGQGSEMWEAGESSHFRMNLASSVLVAVESDSPQAAFDFLRSCCGQRHGLPQPLLLLPLSGPQQEAAQISERPASKWIGAGSSQDQGAEQVLLHPFLLLCPPGSAWAPSLGALLSNISI